MTTSPFRDHGSYDMQGEMNRMFDQMVGDMRRADVSEEQKAQATQWAPAVDVAQKDGDLLVKAELPGVKLEDVDITVNNKVLTIFVRRV
ncbi:MAG: hypothetical protein M3M97_06730 [Actinomycetota bacterium]|nr:hypothetical protein [Actinomycetota bacterium]